MLRRNVDRQYVISGKEQFGYCKREGLVLKEARPENDIQFYEEPALSGTVLLLPGDMIVVAPEDAHIHKVYFIRKAPAPDDAGAFRIDSCT